MTDNTTLDFKLDVKHAIIGVFLIGIATGFMFSALATGLGPQAESGNNQQIDTGNNNPDTGNTKPSGSETVDISGVSADGEPVMGQSDAPVTLYIYEDFECPFCQRFEQGALPQIVSNYVDTGQVKLVWKDFPLTQLHPWAEDGAVAM